MNCASNTSSPRQRWPGWTRDLLGALVLAVGSAGLLSLSFPPYQRPSLAWGALLPLAALTRIPLSKSAALWGAYGGGVTFHLIALDWMRTSSGASGWYGPRGEWWLVLALLLGLTWPFAVWAAWPHGIRKRIPLGVLWPVAWTCGEGLRWYGAAIIDETGFPWLQLGATQIGWLEIAQISDLAGVWGVTFLVASVQGCVVDAAGALVRPSTRARWIKVAAALAAAGSLLLAAHGYGLWRLGQPAVTEGPTVWLIPPWRPSHYGGADWPPASPSPRGTLLLWSETSYLRPLGHSDGPRRDPEIARLERLAREHQVALIVGCSRFDVSQGLLRRYNSAAVISPERGFCGWYDKIALVPYGEFLPWFRPPWTGGHCQPIDHGSAARAFRLNGSREGTNFCVAPTICFDTCFPSIFRQALGLRSADEGVDFFVASSREALDSSGCAQAAMLTATRFRAIECRRAIVRNVVSGYSGLVDSCGRVSAHHIPWEVQKIPWELQRPCCVGPVPLDRRRPLYARFGEWLPLSCLAFVTVATLWRVRSRGRQNA